MTERKPRKIRIYTKTGDRGETGLFGGGRVPKDHPRIEAYGDVDELDAAIGVARSVCADRGIDGILERIQRLLFVLGADLASPGGPARAQRIAGADAKALEECIDRLEEELPPLRRFILPGGSPLAASLHHARTVCRRAERRVVGLAARDPSIGAEPVRFLNRLSDLLFVMARAANHRAKAPEVEWTPEKD